MNVQALEIKTAPANRRSEKHLYKTYATTETDALEVATSYAYMSQVIDYNDTTKHRLAKPFHSVTKFDADINSAHHIIDQALDELKHLGPDWDSNGAIAPLAGNIEAVTQFLRKAVGIVSALKMEEAEMNPVPDGSIDVVWRTRKGHLLINFREPENAIAHFYFDQYDARLGRQGAFNYNESLPEDIQIHLKSL